MDAYPDHIESVLHYLVVLRRLGADLVKPSEKGTQQTVPRDG